MADNLAASPSNPYLKRIADFLKYLQKEDRPEFLPEELSPYGAAAKYFLPQASTIENLAYGNAPFTMAPEGTGSRIPIVKTGRKEEVADIVSFLSGGVPGTKILADATTTGANKLSDFLVRNITRNPEATAPGVLREAGEMAPLSRIFIGPKSSLWDKEAAAKAIEMEKAGTNPIRIWEETGTARGLDKQWRQEISDVGAVLDMEKVPTMPTRIEIANKWLVDQGFVPKELEGVRGVGSVDTLVPKDLQERALSFADRELMGRQKPTVRLTTALEHPELEMAYPNLINNLRIGRETSLMARGKYDPNTGVVTTGGGEQIMSVFGGPEGANQRARSTLLHEIQHAIQEKENWGRGGSPDIAKQIGFAQMKAEMAPLHGKHSLNKYYWQQYGDAARSEYMIRLGEIANRSNIQPRTIYRLQDWYQFGDDYRRQAGPQPKKPGPDRDKWFQGAAEYIRTRKFSSDHKYQNLPYDNIRDAQNAQKRAMRSIKKTDEAAQEYEKLRAKEKTWREDLTDEEAYRRLAGEAEARLTQTREGLTMEERRANYPFAEQYKNKVYGRSGQVREGLANPYGLDVPREQTVAYTDFRESYDPFDVFLGINVPADDPLARFVGLPRK